jgi:glycosyltransferase involved in cell wall biosynthesis
MVRGTEQKAPVRVHFFHRLASAHGTFSVEFIYNVIRERLQSPLFGRKIVAKYSSQGLWRRLYITLAAAFQQGDVNHVTGDVHFLTLFMRKRKTLLTILDVGFMNHPSKLGRAVLRLFWLTLPIARSAMVSTISQATKDEVLKYVRCRPEKIRVVYVPIDDSYTPQPKVFNAEKPVILQIGCAPNKNIERLIDALAGVPCHLDIVGKLGDALREKLQASGLSHSISWNLSAAQIQEKYQACDIVSLISTLEGFGMPIVEANAVGRVVITGNILSMPEVAADAAHLVDPYDVAAMRAGFLQLISDAPYREALIERGYRNRQRFTIDKIVADHAALYQELAG